MPIILKSQNLYVENLISEGKRYPSVFTHFLGSHFELPEPQFVYFLGYLDKNYFKYPNTRNYLPRYKFLLDSFCLSTIIGSRFLPNHSKIRHKNIFNIYIEICYFLTG